MQSDCRLAELELCEKSILEACRQKFEVGCLIGNELRKIETAELFRARDYDSFKTYLRDHPQINGATARRLMKVERTVEIIRNAGLALPATESQATILSKIDRAKLVDFWRVV
jgi:hypothetical protein